MAAGCAATWRASCARGPWGADSVVTPVSSNSALEKCGWFPRTLRTRIGSPFVIAGMQAEVMAGAARVVGYEANGGFLTATDLDLDGRALPPLPTRDTLIVILAILAEARRRQLPVSALVAELPPRYTASNRLKDFPTAVSSRVLGTLYHGEFGHDSRAIEAAFGADFGAVQAVDATDGLRVTFGDASVVHLRPSGNAPEFRCYTEASSEAEAQRLNERCLAVMDAWRAGA